MNGTEPPPPQTNKSVIVIIVLTLCINGTIGMGTMAYCLITKVEPNTALLTAFVAIVNFVLGAISGMLVKTSPTETTKQPLPNPSSQPPSGGSPVPVEVVNEPSAPVPTTTEPHP